ncbi:hypothetical protein CO057_02925 [Candidatus Uhrbacteria bacterium CG_4_9_14_0_2_um_filter_41_50]|uniref:Uncharacterized protein n=1 Tax=Candidatus Uhrbacteria bacterium CG_4_9_14_0_2_um_filter_41_50 TaxID=1975031 RepID=A0A2M8EP12_9BACT|nr:MAG: hypothetical protein COZ45_00775 [Candidatus Uhrbacteria bacterium CG_4_10_14_3_um_filter_41_21]PIZ54808.1 MAG: hypothetical protein COY24_02465 [Candidatus Uhrbacteria bacterium CG_4_10_14_0_2_um_filter_41_21]PJB84611.1 MAG: hypothetical protein CO086_02795 [Candidatus Uhrbacteria bacterium CG_4_9_14_0_8_um_filter_41_16]PJC24397.1 MAG: hypothetical protein CO057_02925 [Candidatus Uhrbacteria bacterium CG_4_9_14_0_2_um_filter_41_50]PJE75168.1 MAG: hypothetical protein COV03_01680 [Candi
MSGHLDGAETTKMAIAREALEEAGITVYPDNLEVAHIMHRYRPEREYFDICFGECLTSATKFR